MSKLMEHPYDRSAGLLTMSVLGGEKNLSDYPVRDLLAGLELLARNEARSMPATPDLAGEGRLEHLGRRHFLAVAKALIAVRTDCDCYGGAAEVDEVLSRLWDDVRNAGDGGGAPLT